MEKKGFSKTGKSPVITVLEQDKGANAPASSQVSATVDKKEPVSAPKSK